MRRAARVDENQAVIVSAMRAAGASVWVIGLPVDLMVGKNGRTALVEVKTLTDTKIPKANKHTRLQKEFMLDWKGGPVATVTDVEGALRVVAMLDA
jgi:hypothetical protein